MLEKELQTIGLNEKESKVYLASLELGQSTVQDISKKAGVNRATAYFVIEALMKMGLMSSFHKGKKQFFIAADPDRLIEILEQEKTTLENRAKGLKKLLPQLQSINNKQTDRPVVKYYEGKEGIKTMVEEIQKDFKNTKKTIRAAYSKEAIDTVFDNTQLDKWKQTRAQQKKQVQVIYTYKDGVLQDNQYSKRRKVPLDRFPITFDIAVYDNKVRIASFSGRSIGIVIEDKEIADSLRAILDLAWEASEKYQA